MPKTAIVVFSDPKSGGEEALGRLFNALFLTWTLKEKEADVALIFQGAGARWPVEIIRPGHPANALYLAVQDKVAGVCGGCADVFGASAALKAAGIALSREIDIPGTTGVIDLSRYVGDGDRLLTF
jgi:DsrE/DsrF-like family